MKNQLVRSFFQLLLYMRPFRGEYLVAMSYSFLNKLFDLIPEILLGVAVNTVIEREHSWLSYWGFQDLRWQLLLLGLVTLVTYGLESLFEYLASTKWWRLAQLVQHSFRMEAFSHVQRSTMTAFSKQKVGNLLSVLNEDINQLERFLEEGVDEIIEVLATSVLVGGIFFFLAPSVALFATLPIPLIIYVTFLFQNRLSPLYLTIRQKAGQLGTQLANSLLGMVTVKSLVAEGLEEAKVAEASTAYKEANFRAIRWGALVVPIVRLVIVFSYLVTLVYGGVLTIERRLDVGAYSALISLCSRMLWPFADLAEISTNFQRVMASTGRLLDLFGLPVEVSPTTPVVLGGKVTFCSVGFAYDQQSPTLRNLSFTISPGQTVAFVGATGAGKTTLLQLLLGFYFPTEGDIFFDDQEVRAVSLSALRNQMGFVSQELFLFEGTIAENISYACAKATRERVIEAARHAAAHEFIMQLPQGYDTWIGERGQTLSGGQKQRLAIARAIVRDPAILILDEATSAVDNETELAIQKSLASISEGRTMVLIAHRLSTVKQADQIFVLKRGTVVEQGTHEELLQQDRLYANLWKLQTGERLTHAELLAE